MSDALPHGIAPLSYTSLHFRSEDLLRPSAPVYRIYPAFDLLRVNAANAPRAARLTLRAATGRGRFYSRASVMCSLNHE
jgi:hypothetical protein